MFEKQIYFACSIRGGRDDAAIYAQLVEYIASKAAVLSEVFADKKLTSAGSSGSSEQIYATDIAWVKKADAIIAEVTNPSLGVGYEIAKAEEWGKPVLALFRETADRKLSAMIDGSPYLTVVCYKEVDDAYRAIDDFLYLLEQKDETR